MDNRESEVRVFISSPGDVASEREKATQVLQRLERLFPGVTLIPVLWEDLVLPVTSSFQEAIDVVLLKQPIDIAVFIVWSRLGSPLGKTIQKADGSTYRSGTEREFELMLHAFEESRRRGGPPRPVILAYTRDDEKGFRKRLAESPKDQLEGLLEQRNLAESFIREQFQDSEGHNLRAIHCYSDSVSFAQRLHTHLRNALDSILSTATSRWPDNPYRGLRYFDVDHAPIFQGRDEETLDLLQRLRERGEAGCASVVIVGASGSGKSSLARAGVAAALLQHPYDELAGKWQVVTLIPGLINPNENLCLMLVAKLAALLPELKAGRLEELAADLAESPSVTVRRGIIPVLNRTPDGEIRLLIVLDQMEELWTDRRIGAEQREQFLEALEALARSGRIAIVSTLRSDFYPVAQLSTTFLRLKEGRGHFDLLAPGAVATLRVITEPARLAGQKFETDARTGRALDQVLLEEATRCAALPLLQFVLEGLYQQRDTEKRMLTFAAYDRLGGVEGALGKRAVEVFIHIDFEAQASLPRVLSLLVSIDVNGDQAPVRRRAALSDLRATPGSATLTDKLIAARFLTTDRVGGTAVASFAHEAILRRWDHVEQWIRDNRDLLHLRARVEQSQRRWQDSKRDPSLLLAAGLPLEEGRQLVSKGLTLLGVETVEYIQASVVSYEMQRKRQFRYRMGLSMGLGVLTIAAVVGLAIGGTFWAQNDKLNAAFTSERDAKEQAKKLLIQSQRSQALAIKNETLAKGLQKVAELKRMDDAQQRVIAVMKQKEAEVAANAERIATASEKERIKELSEKVEQLEKVIKLTAPKQE